MNFAFAGHLMSLVFWQHLMDFLGIQMVETHVPGNVMRYDSVVIFFEGTICLSKDDIRNMQIIA